MLPNQRHLGSKLVAVDGEGALQCSWRELQPGGVEILQVGDEAIGVSRAWAVPSQRQRTYASTREFSP